MAKSDTSFKRVDVLSGIKDVSYLQKTGQLLWIGTHKGMYYYNFVNRAKYSIPELANKDIRSVYTRGNEVS